MVSSIFLSVDPNTILWGGTVANRMISSRCVISPAVVSGGVKIPGDVDLDGGGQGDLDLGDGGLGDISVLVISCAVATRGDMMSSCVDGCSASLWSMNYDDGAVRRKRGKQARTHWNFQIQGSGEPLRRMFFSE